MFDSRLDRQTTDKEVINIHPSEIRILLWDIDGTLIHSNRAGAYKDYFIPTLEEVYGRAGKLAEMQVSGMTDTQIAYEALQNEGFTVADIFAKLDEFIEVLGKNMSSVIANKDSPYSVFQGVNEILTATQSKYFLSSLLTGNLSTTAEIKLRSVNLWNYFANNLNAFGEVSHKRSELVSYTGKQFNNLLQFDLNPEQFIVIGDTPNDIACARTFGAKVVSVGTGRNHSLQELAEYKPDALLEDLSETEKVLEVFKNL